MVPVCRHNTLLMIEQNTKREITASESGEKKCGKQALGDRDIKIPIVIKPFKINEACLVNSGLIVWMVSGQSSISLVFIGWINIYAATSQGQPLYIQFCSIHGKNYFFIGTQCSPIVLYRALVKANFLRDDFPV